MGNLFGKPVSTFLDHALAGSATGTQRGRIKPELPNR